MRPAVLFLVCVAAAAQERPQKACSFDGFSADPKLAEVNGSTTAYFGCSTAKDCRPAKLAAGDPVTPYHTDGDWTCAYLQQRDGAGPGWVRSSDIREIWANPAPPPSAWTGTWVNGSGRILIGSPKASGMVHLEGTAEWRGASSVHTGNFEDDAAPAGNHLHVNVDPCTVDLTLIGNYLVVNDNNQCGGMNVRFWGVWKRTAK